MCPQKRSKVGKNYQTPLKHELTRPSWALSPLVPLSRAIQSGKPLPVPNRYSSDTGGAPQRGLGRWCLKSFCFLLSDSHSSLGESNSQSPTTQNLRGLVKQLQSELWHSQNFGWPTQTFPGGFLASLRTCNPQSGWLISSVSQTMSRTTNCRYGERGEDVWVTRV